LKTSESSLEYNTTDIFNVGVRCDALSVILLNLELDFILKKLDFWVNVSTEMAQIGAYSDNVVILFRNLMSWKKHYRN
jgi:hypothetical protein